MKMKSIKRVTVVFMLILLSAAGLVYSIGGDAERTETKAGEAVRKVPVKLSEVEQASFVQSIKLQGTVESKTFAIVPARIGGTVKELFAVEGQQVLKGQPLCRVDNEQQIQDVESRRQELAVAESALAVNVAQVEFAKADLKKAAKDQERYSKLFAKEAISEDQLEQAELKLSSARASLKVVEAQVSLAMAQVKQVEAYLAMAERDLNDTTINAPINGIISHRFHELGEMAEEGGPVFRIDDPAVLEVSAFIPSQYYRNIVVGETAMRVFVNGIDSGTQLITYRSPTVDKLMRTFEVKCELTAPLEGIVAGSMANVEIILEESQGPGVPSSAILTRGREKVIFTEINGQARMIPVKTGLETNGLVQITEGLTDGINKIVTLGQNMIEDGTAVMVQEGVR
jgi:multidrug efflux pump subunit AcrA (membrane-fusion protein)